MERDRLPAFAFILRQLRKKARLTQKALADRADLPVDTIRGLEYGRREPAWETVDKLADGLGVPVDQFRNLARAGLIEHLQAKIRRKEELAAKWRAEANEIQGTDFASRATRNYCRNLARHFDEQKNVLREQFKKAQAN
jgi:transcriptional regulator with XRE-family HTH domain